MKEKMIKWKDSAIQFWGKRSKSQRGIFIGSILIVVILIVGLTLFTTNAKFVPLYNNLSVQEAGQIKTELDTRKIPYELKDSGTTISVAEDQVDDLLVDLAGQGIPESGNIDYSFFSENTSWGITDNEFNIMKLDAMQTELANLMKGIEGIENAQVMINIPEEPVFVSEETEEASASIVLNTEPGYQFEGNQIDSLYHLVSKAVPNLPAENIVITNQYFEYFDRNSESTYAAQDAFTHQQTIKQEIERDIQRRLQQLLGAMVGTEKVIVSVTADVDFTQENRTEELVEPVDLENMEGLPVSIESIQETYTGEPLDGGTAGTGEEDIANYPGTDEDSDGDYEMVKETINNEFNRIRKDIVESPYKVRDLGIQVAVDRVKDASGEEIQYLTQQDENAVEDGIDSILNSIIGTSIDKEYGEVDPEEKTSIVFQEFSGNQKLPETETAGIPTWLYVIGAISLLAIIVLVVLLLKNRKEKEIYEETYVEESVPSEVELDVPDIPETREPEAVVRKKQLEKIAKENPEDFAKLLRSWIGED